MKTVEELIADLSDENYAVRYTAAEALGKIGPSATANPLPSLVRAMRDESPDVRYHACIALGSFGEEAFPILDAAVRKENLAVQTAACYALARFGPPAIPGLLWALREGQDPDVRMAAAEALGHVRPSTDHVVSALISALQDKTAVDENLQVRHSAISSLDRIGSPLARPAIPALVELLNDEDNEVRVLAKRALRSLGHLE